MTRFPGNAWPSASSRPTGVASAASARTISMTTAPKAITFFIGFRREVLLGVLYIWHC